jgi:zinc-finger binding domain of transposase IS66/Transposase C of IS166 homeodomain
MLQPPSMFTAPTDLPEDPATLQAILRAALTEIERLQLLIAGLQRNRFGRRSETLGETAAQQGTEDLEQPLAEKMAGLRAATQPPQPAAKTKPTTGEPAKRNRGALPLHLPRVEVIIDIEHKACACCGGSLHLIGEDQAEMLDYIPAQLRVRVIRRPRYGCRACENAIVQAAAPDRPSRLTALAWHQSASRPDRWRHGHGSTGGASADRQVQRPPCATNTSTAMEVWNCVRDEGWPLGIRDQERVPNHRELLS